MIINEIRAHYDEFVDHQPILFVFSFLLLLVMIKVVSRGKALVLALVVCRHLVSRGRELQCGGSALHMEDICTQLFAHVQPACLPGCAL